MQNVVHPQGKRPNKGHREGLEAGSFEPTDLEVIGLPIFNTKCLSEILYS